MSEVEHTFDLDAQEEAREAVLAKAKDVQRRLDAAYTKLLSMPEGRLVISELLTFAGLWRLSYTGDREDTFFREGARNVALRVWANALRVSPDMAHKLIQETT